ncbi:MAG TPA: arylsulfatase [Caulobacter sp.]|nr:arylsulfatase [Caulobacter sp.]
MSRPIWAARAVLAVCGLAALLAFGPSAAAPPAPVRPNIVLILIDDGGYTDLGAYGSEIATPHIDALAASGTKFANFHASPMCAPSRAMLLTGVDSHTAGVANLPESTPPEHRTNPAYQGRLAPNVVTVASRLKSAGYHTWMAGKWHLGDGERDLPPAHGFDRSLALEATGGDNWQQRPYFPIYDGSEWYEDGRKATLPEDFYSSRLLVDRIIDNIDAKPDDGRPFFAYLPFLAIHMPVQAPAELVGKYEARYRDGWAALRQRRYEGAVRAGLIAPGTPMGPPPANVADWNRLTKDEQAAFAKRMAVNAAMLEAMDGEVGRLVAHLKANGQYDKTLFVVLSDNGPEGGDPLVEPIFRFWLDQVGYSTRVQDLGGKGSWTAIGPGWASAAAAPGALFKFYASEGGTRVPLVMSGPGVKAGGTARGFSVITDIAPTLLDLAGVAPALSPAVPMDGRSLRPVLAGTADSPYGPADPVGMEAAGDAALWKGNLKLVKAAGPLGDPDWRLYDVAADPGETMDLSAVRPREAAAMLADYRAYAARVGVAEIPADYTPDKAVAKNILESLIGLYRGWIIAAGIALLAALAFAAWRLARGGDRPLQAAARLLLGVVGLLALLIASRFWLAPAQAGPAFALTPEGPAGLGTLRADMAAFFALAGGLSLWAAVRRESRWLWPVLAILGLALAGRFLNLAVTGGGKGVIAPMAVEAALIGVVLLAMRVLPRAR